MRAYNRSIMRDFNFFPQLEAAKLPDYRTLGNGALEPFEPMDPAAPPFIGTDLVGTPIDRLNVLKGIWQERQDAELARRLDVQGDSI